MLLKSVSGEVLYESRKLLIKDAVEEAVRNNVDLSGIDLRHAYLNNARLGGAKLQDACLWGANLSGADLTRACLFGADLRLCDMRGSYWQEANLSRADFRGAKIRHVITDLAHINEGIFSKVQIQHLDISKMQLFDKITVICAEGKCAVIHGNRAIERKIAS